VSGVEGEMWTRLSRIVEREPGAERDRSHNAASPQAGSDPLGVYQVGYTERGGRYLLGDDLSDRQNATGRRQCTATRAGRKRRRQLGLHDDSAALPRSAKGPSEGPLRGPLACRRNGPLGR
jgi:hypothetical protein